MYRADQNDVTYTRNYYHLDDSSINLLRTKEPSSEYVSKSMKKVLLARCFSEANFDGMSFAKGVDILEEGDDC